MAFEPLQNRNRGLPATKFKAFQAGSAHGVDFACASRICASNREISPTIPYISQGTLATN